MPSPGFQHLAEADNSQLKSQTSYSPEEFTALQTLLERQLGPEYLSSRSNGGGQKVAYLPGERAINLANEVFGFNGWNTTVKDVTIDYYETDGTTGRVNLGIAVTLRVTLKDGTYREDMGWGSVENVKHKSMAFGKARKEATTDALKRCLRQFGNVLGNCIYDKTYLKEVGKVKVGAPKFDARKLHRHPDFVAKPMNTVSRPPSGMEVVKKEYKMEKVEEFVPPPDEDDFGEEFFGDEFMDEDFESLMVDGVVIDSDGSDGTDPTLSNDTRRTITGPPETPVPNRSRNPPPPQPQARPQQQPPPQPQARPQQQAPPQAQQSRPVPAQQQSRPVAQQQQQQQQQPPAPQQQPVNRQQPNAGNGNNQQNPSARMNPPNQMSHRPSLNGPRPMNRGGPQPNGPQPQPNQNGSRPASAAGQISNQNAPIAPPKSTPPNQQKPPTDMSDFTETEPLPEIPVPVGFFSAKSASILQSATDVPVTPDRLARFNPVLLGTGHTPGVDHSRSSPVPRDAVKQRAALFDAKQSDLGKELFPAGAGSAANVLSGATYGSSRHLPFKAPTPMKRAAEPPAHGAGGRPALGQASEASLNAATGQAGEGQQVQQGHSMAKRARH